MASSLGARSYEGCFFTRQQVGCLNMHHLTSKIIIYALNGVTKSSFNNHDVI
jgi:hypothetical protein